MPTVETNGAEMYYERRGSGPPVVLVHGAILDHSQWDPQVEALAGDYEVVTYDVRVRTSPSGTCRTRAAPRTSTNPSSSPL